MNKVVDIRHIMPRHRTKQVTRRQLNAIRFWVLHHSLTTSGSPEAFANYHINTNDWSIMAYHYVIMRDGTIYWCADHDIQTPHVGNSNRHSLGACMVGDFRTQTPTKEQYEAALWLFQVHLPSVLPQSATIQGHSEMPGYAWKVCPAISMTQFRRDVQGSPISISNPGQTSFKQGDRGQEVAELQQLLNTIGFDVGAADGIFGVLTTQAVRNAQRVLGITVDGIAGPQTIAAIKKEEERMRQQLEQMSKELEQMKQIVTSLNKDSLPVSVWAEEHWREARINGYFDGKRPQANITRQEVAIVVNRIRTNFLALISMNTKDIGTQTENIRKLEEQLKEIEVAGR
ncbi:hypothetical protein BTR22_14275 [Alkalihalophilus pseudofirmus]|uniref:peptidoglycan recognition protein family protein n=1 Tax=Alkalihalophilus pseudofirmus TaxID=79885 RepID=UPI00095333EC|nr:hypothetical protein BTR22_14275 [Alkalihalophilus pseudofirmus]